jgi:hypothetical protein
MQALILPVCIGFAAGLNAACWGVYKDCMYEEFRKRSFFRGVIIGALLGPALYYYFEYADVTALNLGVFLAVVVAFERAVTEFWKLFIPRESQSKYYIPQQFHIGTKLVEGKLLRLSLFVIFTALLIGALKIAPLLPFADTPTLLRGAIYGLLGGIVVGVGGAVKDAPVEGFKPLKAIRSPSWAMIWGIVFSFFTGEPGILFYAGLGAERMTSEFYKTFVLGRAHSKLKSAQAGEVLFPEWEGRRRFVVPPYLATWIFFGVLLLVV